METVEYTKMLPTKRHVAKYGQNSVVDIKMVLLIPNFSTYDVKLKGFLNKKLFYQIFYVQFYPGHFVPELDLFFSPKMTETYNN